MRDKIKEKLIEKLGEAGRTVFSIILFALSVLPFVIIDIPFAFKLILILAAQFIPFVMDISWIIGLIFAIKGRQDFVTIIYYIVFAAMYVPIVINFIHAVYMTIKEIIEEKKEQKEREEKEKEREAYRKAKEKLEASEEYDPNDKRKVVVYTKGKDGVVASQVPAIHVSFKESYLNRDQTDDK